MRRDGGLRLPEHLLHAQIVDEQRLANRHQQPALESEHGCRRLCNLGLVDKLQLLAVLMEAIDVDVSFRELPGIHN